MMQNPGKRLLIIGLSMLSLTFLLLAIALQSFYGESVAEEEPEFDNFSQQDSYFKGLEKAESEKNIISAPDPGARGGAPVIDPKLNSGIPTGTYSHPPTNITPSGSSSGSSNSETSESSPITEQNSSVEKNRLSQQNAEITTPDYSRPSSSNNFNKGTSGTENSLVEPLGEESNLEAPITENPPVLITPSPIGQKPGLLQSN